MNLNQIKKDARERLGNVLGMRFNVKNSGATNDFLDEVGGVLDLLVDEIEKAVTPPSCQLPHMERCELNKSRQSVKEAFTRFKGESV